MDFQKQITFSLRSDSSVQNDFPLLFAARMLVIFLIWVRGMKHILPPFLPFIPGMEILREFPWLYVLLDWVYWISLIAVFVGFRFQLFSLILGMLVFFVILGAKPQFSNSFLYSGCLLFLIGIYRPGLEWIFRAQIGLLYLGAGVNKLLDPDWQSGQYFQFFFSEVYVNPISGFIANFFSIEVLGLIFSWSTVIIEIALGIWALIGRKTIYLFGAILFFHLSMLVLTMGELSYIFFFLMAVSSYLLLPWEKMRGMTIQYLADSKVSAFLKFFDQNRFFNWQVIRSKQKQGFFHFFFPMTKFLFFNPLFFGLFVVGVTILCIYKSKLSFLISFL